MNESMNNCASSLFKKIATITPKVLLLPFTTTTLFHNLPHVSSLTLCLVGVKNGGKTRERGKWERKYYFLYLVQERKLKRGKIGEKTSHLGPQKFISPNREENRGEKRLQSEMTHIPP